MPILAQISLSGVRLPKRPKALAAAAARFRCSHYVKLHRFLDPAMLGFVRRKLAASGWKNYRDDGGSEMESRPGAATDTLLFFMNHPALFERIRFITKCRPIRSFAGRGYKLVAKGKDAMHWHDDCLDGRLIAVSINLGRMRHKGGVLHMRKKKQSKSIWPVRNDRPGDAVVFRVRHDLEHCVTAIQGNAPKIAFSGWFREKGRVFDCF